MGIAALYRHPRTPQPHPGYEGFPSLLRDQGITRPNQVGVMDLTHLPMRHGARSLVVVLDWATRRVLAWRLATTLTPDGCLDALAVAIPDYGGPGILNTDHGSQVPSTAFVGAVQHHSIALSRDGTGVGRATRFVARLGQTVTYDEGYLHAYDSVPEAQRHLAAYFPFYNQGRPYSALDGRTPEIAYFGASLQRRVA
jgi:putative transposase